MTTQASATHDALDHARPCDGACPSARLAGHMPTGMLDWPGLVATTIFMSGCPLRCPYCHNPHLLEAHSANGEWERVITHLSFRRGWIDGVVVTGGEPTSDPDVLSFLEALVSRGLQVKLDTNGLAPDVLRTIIDSGLAHFVALDVKTLPHRYSLLGVEDAATAVQESIDIVRTSGIPHEFRTTVYPPLIGPAELPELAGLLAGGDLYVLQQFRPGRTLDPVAEQTVPASPPELFDAADACSRILPTITRGV